MELTFLGRGAGFNPNEGSTSAYFIANGELFLIDSGESVFRLLLNKKLLDSVSALNLFISHTHSDHVGSLGSLILYAYIVNKMVVNIIVDKNMAYLPSIRSLMKIYGLAENMYRFVEASDYDGKYSMFDKVRYIKTKHADEMASCALLFETNQGIVFYSGDMQDPAPIVEIIKSGRQIDKIFVDSNSDLQNSHHVSVHQLNDIIPPEFKSKIFCMHINSLECIKAAKAYGFNVVEL